MKFTRNLKVTVLTTYGLTCLIQTGLAIETTTVKTTTVTKSGKSVSLPTTTTYIIVDPITGTLKGNFDAVHGTTDGSTITPGLVIIDQSTGKIVATLDPTGKTIDVISAPAFDPLVVSIDARRSELENMIMSASSAGSIDTNQATALRGELSKIANKEAIAKQSGQVLTYAEALSLATSINNLADRFVLLTHGTPVTPLLGSQFVSTRGQVIMTTNNLEYRRIRLEQRIDDEYSSGRLSAQQVADLQEQLNAVAALDSKYRKNGQLDASETEKLTAKLDSVEEKLNKDVANINDKRSKMGIKVQQ